MAMNLRKFQHKVRCDMPGCRELATHTLGDERISGGLRLNICSKCQQQLALILPKEYILKRPDIVEIYKEIKETAGENSTEEETIAELSKEIDFDNMSMKELRVYAESKGQKIPFGFSKEEAIKMVQNLDNWR